MLKFMRHQQKLTPERIQRQNELYAFTKSCYHGFPSKTTAISWDPELRLLALATKNGDIRVYGGPGVEFYGEHSESDATVVQIVILPGKGFLVSLCDDNSLHLWQLQQDEKLCGLHKIKSTSLDGKLKRISVIKADNKCENLLIGTEGGNIYLLNLATFVMSDNIIYQDVVMQNVPEDYKVNPGPVESIAQHPSDDNKILIGYLRGLIVLWDMKNLTADQTYIGSQQLESVCWHTDATKFISCHNDGSYVIWSSTDSEKPEDGPNTVYGPFPCKPINKIVWPQATEGEFIIFSGGMPRASYGDMNTVTVMQGEKQVAYNLTSRVMDFLVINDKDTGIAECLVILAEEEIIFQDLKNVDWPSHHNPYLSSLHSSAITCSCYVSNVSSDVFSKIKDAGSNQHKAMSENPWPINGGEYTSTHSQSYDLLLTGHEDGTVRFWNATDIDLCLLYTLSTSHIFISEDILGDGAAAEDDDWVPFKKVGVFDPYSDDPRLGIKKMEMCPYSGILVIAGTAGQVIVMQLSKDLEKIELQSIEVNLVAENDSFVWKSHSKFDMIKDDLIQFYSTGHQPTIVMQFSPPASCTSLSLHSEWGLVAAGTAHGFALLDFIQNKCILAKSTLSAADLLTVWDEGPMSRRKSLKKSLRESFRRLRRGRSQRKSGRKPKATNNPTSPNAKTTVPDEELVRPVERAIEARTHNTDYVGSMVRCLHLTKCFISTNQVMTATLWAGTNSGSILVYTIAIPPSDKRSSTALTVQIGKEISLKHGAPVISVMILDAANKPFPEPLAVKKEAAAPPDTSGPHKVLICSEEQFKVFTLPQLKNFCKYKLTANYGTRVRKISSCEFVSSVDEKSKESSFFVATNSGDISVFSLPDCRRHVQAQCLKREDISGINSIVFTKKGEAIYQVSSSELARVSLSAKYITKPSGRVKILSPLKKSDNSPVKEKEKQADVNESTPEVMNEDTKSVTKEKSADATEETTNNTTEDSKNKKATSNEVAKKMEEVNGDQSLLSGDITIDSIKDHMDESKLNPEKSNEIVIAAANEAATTSATTLVSGGTTTTKESTTNVSVIKSTTVTSITSQETSSIQVVETTTSSSEMNHNAVNGSE